MSKEGVIAQQVMLGVVRTAEGLPPYHEVLEGNTAEVSTLKPTIQKILARLPVKRVIAVADRGLLSIDKLQELQDTRCPVEHRWSSSWPCRVGATASSWICSRRCKSAARRPSARCWRRRRRLGTSCAWWSPTTPKAAAQAVAKRDAQIHALHEPAKRWVGTLEDQDQGKSRPGAQALRRRRNAARPITSARCRKAPGSSSARRSG